MSTMYPEMFRCSVCGAKNEYPVLTSTNTLGGPDLDLRPAEMQRSTMSWWIQECPKCGYVSYKVSDKSPVPKVWLSSSEYSSCEGISFFSELARRFYKQYLIQKKAGNTEDAFYAVIRAAWSCDDSGDVQNAKHCRETAIPLITRLIAKKTSNHETLLIIKADLMRRAEQFDVLLAEYAPVQMKEDLLNQILQFEREKAKAHDTGCYCVADVKKNC